jgi:hypothetical protein
MDSEFAIVGQIWQYNNHDLYFIASFDGVESIPLTRATRYWYTLLPINKPVDVPAIIKYDTWTKITEMSTFKRVS